MKVGAVSVAAGSGRLARRDQAVLFDPTGNSQRLVQAFDAAGDDDAAFELIKQLLVADQLQHPPLAAVRWGDSVDLLVFGDLEVETSAPSAPLLSGAASRTWVEHRIEPVFLSTSGSVVVTCGAESAAGTNLRLGVAACSGFRVDLAPGDVDVVPDPPITTWRPDESNTSDELNTSDESGTPAGSAEADPPITTWRADEPNTSDELAEVAVAVDDPANGDVASLGELGADDHSSTHDLVDFTDSVFEVAPPAPIDPVVRDDAGPDHASDPGANYFGDYRPTGEHQPPRPVTVQTEPIEPSAIEPSAVESSATEPIEAEAVPVEDDPVEDDRAADEVPASSQQSVCFGWLDLADATTVAIEEPLVVGRRPETFDGFGPLVVDHPEVSRSHAQIEAVDSLVVITDLGSRNGTWISEPVPGALDGQEQRMGDPIRLEPGEPHVLVDGCVVLLGASDATLGFRSS